VTHHSLFEEDTLALPICVGNVYSRHTNVNKQRPPGTKRRKSMDERWKKFQEALGYTDAQIAILRSDPRKVRAMENAPKFSTHNIVFECVYAENCNGGHKVGDKITLDANGVLLTAQCPKRMCAFAIQAATSYLYGIWERIGEDLEDVGTIFEQVHCPDVGVERGGWGETIWKVYAEPRKK
jgi:uncharacterized repeat protein (TIGR04076 family)